MKDKKLLDKYPALSKKYSTTCENIKWMLEYYEKGFPFIDPALPQYQAEIDAVRMSLPNLDCFSSKPSRQEESDFFHVYNADKKDNCIRLSRLFNFFKQSGIPRQSDRLEEYEYRKLQNEAFEIVKDMEQSGCYRKKQ